MADAAGGSSIGCGAVSDLALCSLSLSLRVFFSDEGFASAGFSSGSNQSSGPLIPSLIDAYTLRRRMICAGLIASARHWQNFSMRAFETPIASKADTSFWMPSDEWREGSEWYRVWSNGLIEQGGIGTTASNGIVSLTFKKLFAAANYFLYGLMDHNSNSAVSFKCVENPPKTSSSATLKATYCLAGENGILPNTSFSWFAIGF